MSKIRAYINSGGGIQGDRFFVLEAEGRCHPVSTERKANDFLKLCSVWGGPDKKWTINDEVCLGYEMPRSDDVVAMVRWALIRLNCEVRALNTGDSITD